MKKILVAFTALTVFAGMAFTVSRHGIYGKRSIGNWQQNA